MSLITNKHKWCNIYDIKGNLVRKGPLKNYTIEETEQLVDNLSETIKNMSDDDPDKRIYQIYLNNATMWLMNLYNKYGNPHQDELLKALQGMNKTSNEEVIDALNELNPEENGDKTEGNTEQSDMDVEREDS